MEGTEDDIVISGMSLRLPECDNITEFWDKLVTGVDMVTEDDRRWPPGLYGLPRRNGKLNNLKQFDCSFFGIPPKQADSMDPQLRLLLEVTYEALADAGQTMGDVAGTPTGVFIGSTFSDAHDLISNQPKDITGYEMTGCNRAMLANRVSYTFDLKGPSMTVDTACSSGLQSLSLAFSAIRQGRCESAVVGGVNLLLKPETSLQFMKLNMLSPDGACKAFDESANGYCRSEGVVALYIQKKSVCKRNYMTIKATMDNVDGYKPEGISYPSSLAQKTLQETVYNIANVDPATVSYVEAHGTGTQAGDTVELNTIEDVFCRYKQSPLLVGSVKSNIGHTEAASGLVSIVKVILSNKNNLLPANLHFRNPNPKIPSLFNNKIKIVSRNTPWQGGIVGINSFGFGGANVHVILETPNITSGKYLQGRNHIGNIPLLTLGCGRTEEGINKILQSSSLNLGLDYTTLVYHTDNKQSKKSLPFRGYAIPEKEIVEISNMALVKDRPLWFVYPGMGCQWTGMGQDFMKIPQFKDVMHLCHTVLQSQGFDLLDLIENSQDNSFDDPLNSFVAICAIQICLTVMLKGIGFLPDGIIGHSVGELACAFADDTLTVEQTILAAYWRGQCVKDANLPIGLMAAVGLTWDEAKKLCPEGVVPACHNAKQTVTISGPADKVHNFVEDLKGQGKFAREVNSSGIAFHSYMMQKCGSSLRQSLEEVIPDPKPRSKKWVSTSVPEHMNNGSQYKMSSAEYHVNNLLSPVLFHEGLQHLPENALVIEIGPHGLLQALLRRELSRDTVTMSTMKKNENNITFFLSTLGRCYIQGRDINLSYLYGDFQYPISVRVPCISPSICWKHDEDWHVPKYIKTLQTQGHTVSINTADERHMFLIDHVIDGRVLYPIAGYIVLVWETLAKKLGKNMDELDIVVKDLKVHEAVILNEDDTTFSIVISNSTGTFEISQNQQLMCSGIITKSTSPYNMILSVDVESDIILDVNDIYKEFRLRGYEYGQYFQRLVSYSVEGRQGIISKGDNWITLLDSMLHTVLLEYNDRTLKLPTRIKEIVIKPEKLKPNQDILVKFNPNLKEITTSCVKIKCPQLTTSQRRSDRNNPILCSYTFCPYFGNTINSIIQRSKSMPRRDRMYKSMDVRNDMTNKTNGLFMQYLKKKAETFNEGTHSTSKKYESKRRLNHLIYSLDICVENSIKSSVDIGFVITTNEGLELIKELTDVHLYYPMIQLNMWMTSTDNIMLQEMKQFSNILPVHSIPDKSQLEKTDIFVIDDCSIKLGRDLFDQVQHSFMILHTKTNADVKVIPGMTIIAESTYKNGKILIMKGMNFSNNNNISAKIVVVDSKQYNWVEELKTELVNIKDKTDSRLWLVHKGEDATGLVGMVNCLLQEPDGDKIRCSINDGYADKDFSKLVQKDLVMNVHKENQHGSYRRVPLIMDDKKGFVDNVYLDIISRGDLSTLQWIESSPEPEIIPNDQEVIFVSHAALNFRDVMVASGRLSVDALPNAGSAVLGLEFAGMNKNKQRRMGIDIGKSLSSRVTTKTVHTWDVPDHWLLQAAATVPIAYVTAYYTLVIRANITKDKKVLIHSACSAVGQAAIRVALAYGCELFVTAGTDKKRRFLMQTYGIPISHVSNSRSHEFVDYFMETTHGYGIDVILNALADEKLKLSLDLLAQNGHFLEIGKYDLAQDTKLGMSVFLKNISFHGVQIETVLDTDPDQWERVHTLVEKGILNGTVMPLKFTTFQHNEVEHAFRYMAEGTHIGKIVIELHNEHNLTERIDRYAQKGYKMLAHPKIKAARRIYFHPNKVYIVTGGLGGLGLEVANWLISRGAKILILTSRAGIKSGYQKRMLKVWEDKGVKMIVKTLNVSNIVEATDLVRFAQTLGPVGGVFHLAAILIDSFFDAQTPDTFEKVISIKAQGIDNLDQLTRQLCAEHLDHFLTFSSASAGYGNAGQTNYAFANSYMERVCENRAQNGYPAKAIQWGFIGDVGIVQDHLGGNQHYHMGMIPQRIPSFLEILELFMLESGVVYSSIQPATKQRTPLMAKYTNLTQELITAVINIIGVKDSSKIGKDTSFLELGLDSLMTTEIRQMLGRKFDINLSVTEVQELSVSSLENMVET